VRLARSIDILLAQLVQLHDDRMVAVDLQRLVAGHCLELLVHFLRVIAARILHLHHDLHLAHVCRDLTEQNKWCIRQPLRDGDLRNIRL
jgi:hypothetical protein